MSEVKKKPFCALPDGSAPRQAGLGQFAENLGTGVYDGMWVGSTLSIPTTNGWRISY